MRSARCLLWRLDKNENDDSLQALTGSERSQRNSSQILLCRRCVWAIKKAKRLNEESVVRKRRWAVRLKGLDNGDGEFAETGMCLYLEKVKK